MYLNDLTFFYLRCRFACVSLGLTQSPSTSDLYQTLLLPAKAALLSLAAVRITKTTRIADSTAIRLHSYKISRAAAGSRSRGKSYSNTKRGNAARMVVHIPAGISSSFKPARLPIRNAFLLDGFKGAILFSGKRMGAPCPRAALRGAGNYGRSAVALQNMQFCILFTAR